MCKVSLKKKGKSGKKRLSVNSCAKEKRLKSVEDCFEKGDKMRTFSSEVKQFYVEKQRTRKESVYTETIARKNVKFKTIFVDVAEIESFKKFYNENEIIQQNNNLVKKLENTQTNANSLDNNQVNPKTGKDGKVTCCVCNIF